MRELTHIEIRARRVAHHALLGEYQSVLKGAGLDFVEHRRYVAGDDYRQIDWNVLARTRQTYLKVCREEKEMTALIVADLSGSMDMGSTRYSKFEVLVEAVAAIAFSAVSANISVGVIAGADGVAIERAPNRRRTQPRQILNDLLNYQPARPSFTDLKALMVRGYQVLKHPSLFFLISDFIVSEKILADPLVARISSDHDLIPILIEDRLELNLPPLKGSIRLRDLEESSTIRLSLSEANCKKIANDLKMRRERVQNAFFRVGALPITLHTDQASLRPLMEFFLTRRRSQ
jgi:uncharacterized protein (DUF58 family)